MGNRYHVLIQKIVYPGKSLGYAEGKAVFTDEGLPGEKVLVKAAKIKKTFIEGRTEQILEASSRRQKPRCAHYRICGPYQVMDYELQLAIKRQQLEEIFSHQLGLSSLPLEVIASPLIWGYRNRAHFHVLWKEKVPSLAYHQPGALTAFETVDRCYLLPERVNDILHQVVAVLEDLALTEVTELEIRHSQSTEEVLLAIFADESSPAGRKTSPVSEEGRRWEDLKNMLASLPLTGVVIISRKDKLPEKRLLLGQDVIWEKIDNIRYALGSQSFFQVNVALLRRLLADLKSLLPLTGKERLADFYCGVGTFGLALASEVAEVVGIEFEPENISLLQKNLKENKIDNFHLAAGEAALWSQKILPSGREIVIVDPPRRGLEREVLQALLTSPSRVLTYLSCNPATLARDLKKLLAGYSLVALKMYDFFPQTPHIETLVILEKKSG